MTILEDTDSDYRSELKLWENKHGQIWIEVGYGDNDPCTTQGIPLSTDDARALIRELTRLVKHIEPEEHGTGKQLPLTPPLHDPGTGQLPFPSKVNWNK